MTERQQQITALAAELFAMYIKEDGWTFSVMPNQKYLGVCYFSPRVIVMSDVYVDTAEWDLVEDTLRHEIAHAIAGPAARHGAEWRRVARLVGANPRACKDLNAIGEEYIRLNYKYQMVVIHDDGELEILKLYAKRRTNLKDKMVVGRRETKNKLTWVKL